MCTVTVIPIGKNDFILTSNRDEAPDRISLIPDFYDFEDTMLLYPKDELASGTWIGLSEKNRLVCMLNGAYNAHKQQSRYRMSRGVVAKDFMVADSVVETMKNYNLKDIEPFTMVIVVWDNNLKFYELVWDGSSRQYTELPLEPKIWSSSTLYNEAMRHERLQWFEDFKGENNLDAKAVLQFHKSAGKGNLDYGVMMNRGVVKTTSITQVKKQDEVLDMRYENLQDNVVSTKTFNLPEVVNE